MELIILGSGTLAPTLNRHPAGIVVNIDDIPVLIDSGSGILYKLPLAGIDYRKIDNLFYSHYAHPDHVNDVIAFLFANKYDFINRDKALNIYGPKGLKSFFKRIKKLYPIFKDIHFEINLKEMGDEKLDVSNFKVISKPMKHGKAKANGYRFEVNNKSIMYTGDTDYCQNAVDLARNVDILITECSFPDELYFEGHLTPARSSRIAAESGAKMLVLTHLYPICEDYDIAGQAAKAYDGEIIVAKDLMRLTV